MKYSRLQCLTQVLDFGNQLFKNFFNFGTFNELLCVMSKICTIIEAVEMAQLIHIRLKYTQISTGRTSLLLTRHQLPFPFSTLRLVTYPHAGKTVLVGTA